MSLELISVAIVICEKFLQERDGVFSAIRIIDLLYVPASTPGGNFLQINILVFAKTANTGQANLKLSLLKPDGREEVLNEQQVEAKTGIKDVPVSGFTMVIQLNLEPKEMGTYFLKLWIDGKEAARTPITLLRPLSEKPD